MSAPPEQPGTSPPFALREAHAHLLAYGQSLGTPSLTDCPSLAACLDRIAEVAAATSKAGADSTAWLRFTGARHQHWPEARWPTPAELEAATRAVPTVVMSFDHHTAVCNASALAAAGLRAGQMVPPNGQVETDEAGNFSGLLSEQAAYRVWSAGPEPTRAAMRDGVRRALRSLAALGYRQVHDMLAPPLLPELLAELAGEGEVLPRIVMYCAPEHAEVFLRVRSAWPKPLRFGGIKLFADGTLSSRTALMMHRYSEPLPDASRGRCMVAPAAIGQTLGRCHELGIGLAVHAIGDAAVKMVLDCIDRLDGQIGGAAMRRCRVRIEHAELIDKPDVARFVRMNVDCSVQPCHLLTDIEALRRFVPHRLDRVLPLRELLDAGLVPGRLGIDHEHSRDDAGGDTNPAAAADAPAGLVFGSDVPIVRADPFDSVFAAVNRRRPDMAEAEAIAPAQAITAQQAWQCLAAPN